jgi:hypothetical protein
MCEKRRWDSPQPRCNLAATRAERGACFSAGVG